MTPTDLTSISDDDLTAELARRRAEQQRTKAASGEALAGAVRRFLAIDVIARAAGTDPAWGTEWVHGTNGLRISDIHRLATALADYDRAQTDADDGN